MPKRPNIPCRHPGCPILIPSGDKYCETHKPLHPEEQRSAAERGYGNRWRQVRTKYLKAHPLCVKCMAEGKYIKATVVDHIKPHRGDQKLLWDESNWQALCKKCHDKKTWTEDKNPEYKY